MDLQDLLKYTHKAGASDLHITVGIPPMVRIDGELRPVEGWPRLMPDHTRALAYSILQQRQVDELTAKKELDLSYGLQQLGRYRVNIYQQRGSLAMAIRVIAQRIPSIQELGLPEVIKRFANADRGLVLVTGPTGSGKSTTLAAMIQYINEKKNMHIMTIEDPIEYLYRHQKCMINQRQVHDDTLSFHEALRRVLRQDPDVILIGEMRDKETTEIALTMSETGHLVFGTLHTNDTVQSITRIVDIFPPGQQDQIRIQLSF
ncbi:MAG: type IV pilus twitching motility protein PilT, partial [Planctomycetota bacterium]